MHVFFVVAGCNEAKDTTAIVVCNNSTETLKIKDVCRQEMWDERASSKWSKVNDKDNC